jgi:DNA-binding response OmpR family regulator
MSSSSSNSRCPHILCINNDLSVLALFRDLLEDAGYQVSTQPYVDRDLDAIKALQPDLIVLDYMWATEDASWSLLQMLRMDPTTAAIPIVLCTGAVREVEAMEGHLNAMGVNVVFKPFNIGHLLEAIRAQLGVNRALERDEQ